MKPILIPFIVTMMVLIELPSWAFDSVKQPILYPNAHFEIMGRARAQEDIDNCWNMARDAGASETNADNVSRDAADDAAAWAVFGAAASAALGGDPHRAAVAGAVGGGAASMAAGMLEQSNPPPVFRGIVERCLFEKGYEVAGWE